MLRWAVVFFIIAIVAGIFGSSSRLLQVTGRISTPLHYSISKCAPNAGGAFCLYYASQPEVISSKFTII